MSDHLSRACEVAVRPLKAFRAQKINSAQFNPIHGTCVPAPQRGAVPGPGAASPTPHSLDPPSPTTDGSRDRSQEPPPRTHQRPPGRTPNSAPRLDTRCGVRVCAHLNPGQLPCNRPSPCTSNSHPPARPAPPGRKPPAPTNTTSSPMTAYHPTHPTNCPLSPLIAPCASAWRRSEIMESTSQQHPHTCTPPRRLHGAGADQRPLDQSRGNTPTAAAAPSAAPPRCCI